MECGCLKGKRFAASDGGNLTGLSAIVSRSTLRKRNHRFWEITTDPETMPENSKEYVMTEIPGLNYKDVGNLYGCRNWVEYGLNQSKNELGWADFRLTKYQDIEKWWKIVCSTYLLVSLFADLQINSEKLATTISGSRVRELLQEHPLRG